MGKRPRSDSTEHEDTSWLGGVVAKFGSWFCATKGDKRQRVVVQHKFNFLKSNTKSQSGLLPFRHFDTAFPMPRLIQPRPKPASTPRSRAHLDVIDLSLPISSNATSAASPAALAPATLIPTTKLAPLRPPQTSAPPAPLSPIMSPIAPKYSAFNSHDLSTRSQSSPPFSSQLSPVRSSPVRSNASAEASRASSPRGTISSWLSAEYKEPLERRPSLDQSSMQAYANSTYSSVGSGSRSPTGRSTRYTQAGQQFKLASASLKKKLELMQIAGSTESPPEERDWTNEKFTALGAKLKWYDTNSDQSRTEIEQLEAQKESLVARRLKRFEEAGSLPSAVYRAFYAARQGSKGPDADLYAQKKRTLTPEEDTKVTEVLARRGETVLVTQPNANIDLTYTLVSCLAARKWLNDEVINFYFQLLKERNDRAQAGKGKGGPQTPLKAHFFNSFFTVQFHGGYSYKKVKRWSKRAKVKILELHKVFVPVHVHGNHWCLAVINLEDKRFEYYDSLQGGPGDVLVNLRRYVVDEAAAYSNKPGFDLSGWEDYVPEDIPLQDNGSDCGVFTCKFADYLGERLDLTFSAPDMPYFRRRLMTDLLANSAD